MRSALLLAALATTLAVAACSDNRMSNRTPDAAAPADAVGPLSPGMSDSVNAGSSSNAASGSTVRSQEGGIGGPLR
jgi:hypothetical protein